MKMTVFSFLLLALLFPFQAEAALGGASRVEGLAAAFNPRPAPGDIELPMKRDLKMVLRAVAVPQNTTLDDTEFRMGLPDSDKDRKMYERTRWGHIGAPFKLKDLPKDWQSGLSENEKAGGFHFYFIGKYEISNAQWAAVMDEPAPEQDASLPKANISWYDLQKFLQTYNEWLLTEHFDALPKIGGEPGFLRLPTEEEWEFAALGGARPPEEEGEDIERLAVFKQEGPLPIGERDANRLGIHNMAGNVAELVQDGFRFTIPAPVKGSNNRRILRPHGSEGGLLLKGGDFLAREKDKLLPGKREEIRMFKKQDGGYVAHESRTMGARLVFSTINVAGEERRKNIVSDQEELDKTERKTERANSAVSAASESGKMPEDAATGTPAGKDAADQALTDRLVRLDPEGDPLEELQKIYEATSSPFVKSNLGQFRDLLEGVNMALKQERDENIMNSLRSAIYKESALLSTAYRCYEFNSRIKMIKDSGVKIPKDKAQAYQKTMQENFENLKRNTRIYLLSVEDLAPVPKEDMDKKLIQLKNEYSGGDSINTAFRRYIDVFSQHLDMFRKQQTEQLTNESIWKDIIPSKAILKFLDSMQKDGDKSGKKAALDKNRAAALLGAMNDVDAMNDVSH